MPKGTPFPRPVTGSAWHWTWSPTFLSSPSIYHSTEMSKRCFFLDFAQQRVFLSQSPWWVPVDSPHVLLASSILIKFQDSPPRSIPAEPHYKTVACQPPSMWVSPALGISEIWKIAHRLSPATATPPHCRWGWQGAPQRLAWCRHTGPSCWLQFWVGQRAILREAETSGALDLTSRPESASHAGAGVGVGDPFSLSGEAPFSWRDIKTHTKRFHVGPALSLCPSRRINPRAARTDMSSQLCFHVCPQFQRHHTKSRLIVNRPPLPPCPASPPPLHIWIPQPFPGASETCSGSELLDSNLISLPFPSPLNIWIGMFFSFL